MAIHLATGELAAAAPNAPLRWLVGRGLRLDRMAPLNKRVLDSYRRRHDPTWALERLNQPPPCLHRHGVVAIVSLLEVWAHHEDVLHANGLGDCPSDLDLAPVIAVLVRYQRRILDPNAVCITSGNTVWYQPRERRRVTLDGTARNIARWLTGRGPLDLLEASAHPDVIAALATANLTL